MKKSNRFLVSALAVALALGPAACTNMTKTQQGTVSGAAGGALLGTVIGAVANGRSGAAAGAVIGAVAGGLAGVIVGNTQEQYDQGYCRETDDDNPSYDRGYQPPAK
jgi:ABC-type Mn2+/Zn2+ transport system permease subunit